MNSILNQFVYLHLHCRLRLFDLDEDVEGVYTCTSQLSGETQRFQLTKGKSLVLTLLVDRECYIASLT